MNAIITLLSDYGLVDPYTAAVKGTIYRDWPEARLCDISHQVAPGNLVEAAFILRNSFSNFPEGSVHLVMVNEINRSKRWLAAEVAKHYFVLPDNGILPLLAPKQKPDEVRSLNFRREESLFPARDLMAPAATHLAKGGRASVLGPEIDDWRQSRMDRHTVNARGNEINGSVIYVDNYGNLITNIGRKLFESTAAGRDFEILLPRNHSLKQIAKTYTEASGGSIIALFNSAELLEIAAVDARGRDYNGANSLLGLDFRATVTIKFHDHQNR